jgi:transcriptional regulator with XRE-family HTH domain
MPPSESADQALAFTIRRLREERGFTQEDIAYSANLTSGTYGHIERGRTNPTWTTIKKIATALDITLTELAASAEAAAEPGAASRK